MSHRDGMPELTREEVLKRLEDVAGCDVSAYSSLLQRSIWLRSEKSGDVELMGCRFGGPAMAEEGFVWPTYCVEPFAGHDAEAEEFTVLYAGPTRLPMWLIAQINLAELPLETALPHEGLLSFFTDPFDGVWGNEKSDAEGIRVVYVPPERFGKLRPIERPVVKDHPGSFSDSIWPTCRMSCFPKWSFSDWDGIDPLYDQVKDQERLSIVISEIFGNKFGHFLLDGGNNHQHDPRVLAEGFWNPKEDDRESSELYRKRAKANWTCLLSITQDNLLRPVVSDCGGLSFMIRKADLAERRFDRPWIVRS